jgi:hypothetical protein
VTAQGIQGSRWSMRSLSSIVQSFLTDRDSLAMDCGEIVNGPDASTESQARVG